MKLAKHWLCRLFDDFDPKKPQRLLVVRGDQGAWCVLSLDGTLRAGTRCDGQCWPRWYRDLDDAVRFAKTGEW